MCAEPLCQRNTEYYHPQSVPRQTVITVPVYTGPDKFLLGQNLQGSTLRSHGTGGSGWIFERLQFTSSYKRIQYLKKTQKINFALQSFKLKVFFFGLIVLSPYNQSSGSKFNLKNGFMSLPEMINKKNTKKENRWWGQFNTFIQVIYNFTKEM